MFSAFSLPCLPPLFLREDNIAQGAIKINLLVDKLFVRYPGKMGSEYWDKEMIRKRLQAVRDFQKRHNARIFVGEFSAILWAPGAADYLRDCIEIFEEYGWDWTYHAFREWDGWSLEHEGTPGNIRPSANNDRKEVMLKGFRGELKKK